MKAICVLLTAFVAGSLAAKLPFAAEEVIEEDFYEPPKPYNFGFEVRDDETTNYQNRAEVSDDLGRVKGSYSYVLPDGFIYTVSYTVDRTEDPESESGGFKAVVRREPSGIEVVIPEPYAERLAREKAQNKQRI